MGIKHLYATQYAKDAEHLLAGGWYLIKVVDNFGDIECFPTFVLATDMDDPPNKPPKEKPYEPPSNENNF